MTKRPQINKILLISLAGLILGMGLFLASSAKAQSSDDPYSISTVANKALIPVGFPVGIQVIPKVAATIINTLVSFVGSILLVIVIYAGFLWMTAAGSEEKVKKAKSLLTNAVIGLFIIMAGYGISRFIISTVKNATQDVNTFTPLAPRTSCSSASNASCKTTCTGITLSNSCPSGQVCCQEFNIAPVGHACAGQCASYSDCSGTVDPLGICSNNQFCCLGCVLPGPTCSQGTPVCLSGAWECGL